MIEVNGRSFHRVEFDTKDPAEAVRRFRKLFPGATVETVGPDAFIASCEACGAPIFEGQPYDVDEDAHLCADCTGLGGQ